MKKKYGIEWNNQATVIVEIDHSIVSDDDLHEINNFWGDAEWRLEMDGDGCIVKTVLKMLTSTVLSEAAAGHWVERVFNEEGVEGWPKMDGSEGFKLISYDEPGFDYCDMDFNEVVA